MSIRVRVQITNLAAKAEAASAATAKAIMAELFGRFQAAMGAKAWAWPNLTERRSDTGRVVEVAGSPRNIVNLGILRASGSYQMLGKYTALFQWAAGYATAVHEGARLRNGGFIPPRPWTDVVLGRIQGAARIEPYPMAQRAEEIWLRYMRL